jgi:hypothetical protein
MNIATGVSTTGMNGEIVSRSWRMFLSRDGRLHALVASQIDDDEHAPATVTCWSPGRTHQRPGTMLARDFLPATTITRMPIRVERWRSTVASSTASSAFSGRRKAVNLLTDPISN